MKNQFGLSGAIHALDGRVERVDSNALSHVRSSFERPEAKPLHLARMIPDWPGSGDHGLLRTRNFPKWMCVRARSLLPLSHTARKSPGATSISVG